MNNVISRVTVLNIPHAPLNAAPSTAASAVPSCQQRSQTMPKTFPRNQRRHIVAMPRLKMLTSPRRAEQETQSNRHGQCRIRAILDRLVDSFDKFVGYLAHCIDRLAALVLRIRHSAVDAGSRSLPCRAASIGDDVGHL